MKNTLTLLLFFLFSCLNSLFGQELKYFGSPFIKQYLPEDYQGTPQVWDIAQDQRGLMYFGDTEQLLEFDGTNWRKYKVRNNSMVRSLAIDSTGKICIGGTEEFGWFAPDSTGNLVYSSLSKQLVDSLQNFGDIWKTISVSTGVYFFARTKIFHWYQGKLNIINAKLAATFGAKAFDQIYLIHLEKGLCLLKDTVITQLISDKDLLKLGTGYKSICEFQNNKLLIATSLKGFFIYDIESQKLIRPKMNPQILDYLKQNTTAYSLTKINDNAYAVSTFKGGTLVFNAKLELTDVVNSMRGLQNDCVYSLFTDKNHNLWAALQNGIARIAINNPLRSFGEKQNMKAYGLDAVFFDNKKYVATLNGCFFLEKHSLSLENDNHKFKRIPELEDVWDLSVYKNKLLACGRDGISQIRGNKAKVLFETKERDPYILNSSTKFPNYLFIGYGDGFSARELITQNNSEYLKAKKNISFAEITGEVRSIAEDKNGNLWLGMGSEGGVYIHFLNDNDISNYELTFFDSKNGLPNNEYITTAYLNKQVNILTTKGIYTLSKQANQAQNTSALMQFEHNKSWGNYLSQDSTYCYFLVKMKEDLYLLTADKFSAFMENRGDSMVINKAPFVNISGISNLVPEQNYINVCTNSSFAIYDTSKDSLQTNKIYPSLIRKVVIAQDSVLFNGTFYTNTDKNIQIIQGQSKKQIPTLSYDNNSIKIHFSAIFYDKSEKTQYSYFLEGFDTQWSAWEKESKAVFTTIFEGKYKFQVKAKNIYDVESTIATYEFVILAPWYRTTYAYLAYFLFLAGFIWGVVKLNSRRLVKEKLKLENIVRKRTEEVQQQKEEILTQNEELMQANEEVIATSDTLEAQNKQLEKSYNNIQLLSVIGQKITSKLSVEDIIDTAYENVNQLMDAEVFAIGILNIDKTQLDFHGTKEKGETLAYHFDKLTNKNALSVYCYDKFDNILLEDVDTQIGDYLGEKPIISAGNSTKSLIYLPLGTLEKKIGVISVQSFKKNAYAAYHLNILRNIAIYTSIALENANAYLQITTQHDKIQTQHHEIKSSLNYASTIQNAILPAKESMDKLFDNFIIYRPKDIVSGDFYWLSEVENTIFVAVVDCTGHGVPGAFMSMIGSRLLDNIVRQRKIIETDAILEELNIGVRKALRQEQTDNTDGMDICLCKIDRNDLGAKITFTGAKRSLFVYQNGKAELLRIRGDKKAIGGHHFQGLSFTQTKLSLQKGDTIYLTTDGLIDQNNGQRKKFSTTKLIQLLNQIQEQSLSEQQKVIENELDNWQGEEEQRDDITIIGIKI